MVEERYDVIVVGTGFASSFFLWRFLARAPVDARVLVLERGRVSPHRWQMEDGLQGRRILQQEAAGSFVNSSPHKPWIFLLAHGGSSNCWFGNTPRMLPEDFRLHSLYGVGEDWPVSYEELEEYYCDVEEAMAVAGPSGDSPFPRSRPYPQPPHRLSDVDRLFKRAFPDSFFHLPCARPTVATSRRPVCCGNGVCMLCPIDSKFTVANELGDVYADPRVTLRHGAAVQQVEVQGGTTATGVRFLEGDRESSASGDLVVLGANGLFNPHILLRSGLSHPELGTGLVEQVSKVVRVDLDGVDNFQGSTVVTGHGYMLYGGEHRRERAAALIETNNRPTLRRGRGKWRQIVLLRVVYEDLRQRENAVTVDPDDPRRPRVTFAGHSAYAHRGMDALPAELERLLAPLPVERILVPPQHVDTESHVLGTTPMGTDPARSVVDRHLLHHQVRNLLVLGGSVFPTAAPANPTLTLSALAVRAADHVTGGRLA